jgi:hypothetical protein
MCSERRECEPGATTATVLGSSALHRDVARARDPTSTSPASPCSPPVPGFGGDGHREERRETREGIPACRWLWSHLPKYKVNASVMMLQKVKAT